MRYIKILLATFIIFSLGYSWIKSNKNNISTGLYNNTVQIENESPFKWPEGKKMAISLTFDDARITQIDKGIPLLDK